MTFSSERYLQLLREAVTTTPDTLPDGFPFSEYQSNLARYNEQDSWYNGQKLEEEIVISGKDVAKYPVRINPIQGTCQRHVAMLFGDIQDDDQLLITPRVVKKAKASKQESELADLLEDALIQVWYDSNGRDIQLNNGLVSQRYGGCVFYAKYDPSNGCKYPITIEAVNPKYFIGIPNSSNPFQLEEAWIVKPVTKSELENQGIAPLGKTFGVFEKTFSDDVHWLCEHYTKQTYEVFVGKDRVGRKIYLPGSKTYEVVPFGDGGNVFGVVPIVYIPHIRNTSNFYGNNCFDVVTGIVKEMNARVADFGDAVSMDSHDIVATRNINGNITVTQLIPGVARIDLGSGINVTGQEGQPEAQSLRRSGMASSSMKELVTDILYKQYRRDAVHPAVCDGEDEGSQRSSQTLTTRMWALETHANMERIEWTAGLNWLSKIIVKILAIKDPASGITQECNFLRLRQVWYPTLKRDRMDIVTELTTRVGGNLSSIRNGLEKLGDVENVEEERAEIIRDIKEINEIKGQNQLFGNQNPEPKKTVAKKSNPTQEV